jgi:hypothetical protein
LGPTTHRCPPGSSQLEVARQFLAALGHVEAFHRAGAEQSHQPLVRFVYSRSRWQPRAGEPSLAGRLEDLQLSRMAPTNFLSGAYFKAAAGQTDAILTRAASPSRLERSPHNHTGGQQGDVADELPSVWGIVCGLHEQLFLANSINCEEAQGGRVNCCQFSNTFGWHLRTVCPKMLSRYSDNIFAP